MPPPPKVVAPPAIVYAPVTADDLAQIAQLHEMVFGPGRFARTAFRVREMAPCDPALSLSARSADGLVGAVLQSAISVGGVAGVWLGPIAVTAKGRRAGVGASLMRGALAHASGSGAAFVLLVGDADYYGRFGFAPVPAGQITLPGPADPARVLGFATDKSPNGNLPCGAVAITQSAPILK